MDIKNAVKALPATSLGWRTMRHVRPPGVIVLMYHRVAGADDRFPGHPVELFRAQMQWVATHCRPIAPAQIKEAAADGRVDRPAVLVTFDDGYLSYSQRAYPVLKELGIPALVFLTTSYVDDPTRLFWWDALGEGIMRTPRDGVELPWSRGTVVPLPDRAARARLLRIAKEHLKGIPAARHETEVAELLDRLGTSKEALRAGPEMMSWSEVEDTLDLTCFGGHTDTHPILSMVSDERIDNEIATCREKIASATGSSPRFFAYPNGRVRDFDERSRAALRRHGFDVAFSNEEGVNGPETDWMAVRRFAGDGPLPDLVWRLLDWRRR